eukprot:TRINITY_DN7054_c0_g1_i3.p1 TRINITY_DN7054_c0_g1~~TRINITY_DN7054_c0_g1_i3.p1  ORF type:complete len:262 (+),score=50.68 TRINITY_DN7054_c0_g1_i3:508-1293(+)
MEYLGLILCLGSVWFHTGLLVITKIFLKRKFRSVSKNENLWNAANWLVSALQAALATLVGLCVVLYAKLDVLHTNIQFLKPYAWFNLGYWLYDLVCMYILVTLPQGKTRPNAINLMYFIQWWPGIVFHHIGIIAVLLFGIIFTSRVRGDGIVGLALLMELSSIFVALRSFLAKLEMKGTRAYLLVSILMVLTFFSARIVLIPAVLHLYSSQSNLSLLQGLFSLPLVCRIGTACFYSLNIYWFSLMVKGCVKAVRLGGLKEE